MVETEVIRQKILTLSGTALLFDSGTLYGFPGFSMSHLYNGESSVYVVENPQYSFTITTQDVVTYEVAIDAMFTMTDNVYEYEFKVDNTPLPFLDGWSKLEANLIGKTLL